MKIREPGGRNLQIYENSSDGTTERERREGDKERDVRGGHTNREIRGAGMARDEKPPPPPPPPPPSPLLGSEGNAQPTSWPASLHILPPFVFPFLR
jgi:hypothetical protein